MEPDRRRHARWRARPLRPAARRPSSERCYRPDGRTVRVSERSLRRPAGVAKEEQLSHTHIGDASAAVAIQPGAVVSKVVYRDEGLNVTVFGFDSGEGLTEHQAGRAAVVQILSGRLRFTADGEELDAGPGFWLHMEAGTPHALVATEPTVMLLTLISP